MVGRLHSAAQAVELGFTIEPDNGPSGNLRHWRIVGVPDEVCDLFSKRSDEISAYIAETGHYGAAAGGDVGQHDGVLRQPGHIDT